MTTTAFFNSDTFNSTIIVSKLYGKNGGAIDFKQGGQAIQRIRKEYGMTQEQLAELTDITFHSVSLLELGLLMPTLSTLIGICNALGTGSDSTLAEYTEADTLIQ